MKISIRPTFSPVSTFRAVIKPKGISRHERKERAVLNRQLHPVLSGAVKVESYIPPVAYYGGKRIS
jgi:hypothetical protein